MAFTRTTVATNNISSLADKPNQDNGLTSAQLKALWDKYGEDNNDFLNDVLIDELESTTDGSSGAKNIGLPPIANLGNVTNVEDALKAAAQLPNLTEVINARTDNEGNIELNLKNRLSKMQYFVNVKSFGAKVDGVTDDTLSLKAAIESINGKNGVIFIPDGTMIISGLRIGDMTGISNSGNIPIAISTGNITILGVKNTIIKLANNNNTDMLFFRLCNNVTIKNLTFDGNKNNQSGSSTGLWNEPTELLFRDCSNITIENCNLINGKHFGANISSDSNNILFQDNIIDSCVTGVDFQGQYITCRRNKVTNCTSAGIEFEGENVDINFTTFTALNAFCNVENNYVSSCNYGVYLLGGCYDINIKDNKIFNCQYWGIGLNGTALTLPRRIETVNIENNYVYNCKFTNYGYGIDASQSKDIVIKNNKIYSCTMGIHLYDTIESLIDGNKSQRNDTHGCSITTTIGDLIIQNNKFINNNQLNSAGKVGGLIIIGAGDSYLISGNMIGDKQTVPTQKYGIIMDSNPTNVLIANNDLTGNISGSTSDWSGSAIYNLTNNLIDQPNSQNPKLYTTITPFLMGGKLVGYASSIPVSGTYSKDDIILNTNTTQLGTTPNKYIVLGWKRITNSSNHVLNTDWYEMRTLTGN